MSLCVRLPVILRQVVFALSKQRSGGWVPERRSLSVECGAATLTPETLRRPGSGPPSSANGGGSLVVARRVAVFAGRHTEFPFEDNVQVFGMRVPALGRDHVDCQITAR